jgi:hypothetical protein
MGRKKGRLAGSKNKTYTAVPRITRSSHAAYIMDKLNKEFTAPKNQNGIHNFSFNNSYKDSNSEEDNNYINKKVKNDKLAYYAVFYAGAKSNPTDLETLEEAKASSN